MNILLTGGAGFIGSHLSERLLMLGHKVTVLDNFDDFYSADLKRLNLSFSLKSPDFRLFDIDIRKLNILEPCLDDNFDVLIHLAAKAGVQPSLDKPIEYTETNILGTQNLLELARVRNIKKFIFASSSSIYGVNDCVPWKEDTNLLRPISPYAATKLSGEFLGQVYSNIYNIQFIALRFFTVFGPRQRPDLAIHKFTRMIANDEAIPVYGNGLSKRDYTYIDDIINGVIKSIDFSASKFEVFNLGNSNPVSLMDLIWTIERVVKKKAIIDKQPDRLGDVPITCANIEKAEKMLCYKPVINLEDGISNFYQWFKNIPHNYKNSKK